MHNLRRERTKNSLNTYLGKGKPREELHITAEEFEQVRQKLKERDAQQERYTTKMTVLILAVIAAVIVLTGAVLQFFVF